MTGAAPTERVHDRLTAALTGLPLGSPRPQPPEQTPLEAGPLRARVGPLLLMLSTPALSVLFWIAVAHHDGSLWAMLRAAPGALLDQVPAPSARAVAIVAGWIAFQALLLRWLPGRAHQGPVTPAGVRPTYRLNGVAAWAVTHGLLFGVAWPLGWLDPGRLYALYGELLMTLLLSAFAFCLFLYWKGRRYPSGPDAVYTGVLPYDFFQGVELHPRLLGVNLKQLVNCRVSMMGWSVVVVSCLLAQYERHGLVSSSMVVSVTVLAAYLLKFFVWEGGYFGSLDIMHDRFGYYICWGVLVWVPAVYCLPALWLVDHPIHWPPALAAGMVTLGLLGIWVNYQADAQRQRVRETGGETTVWGRPPELLRARYTTRDGETRESLLLLSGWWGVARHFHYVPELTVAFAWTVPAGFTHLLPWFYWFFLLALLVDRARRDEHRCAAKYGAAWSAYCARVRWRILPGVY